MRSTSEVVFARQRYSADNYTYLIAEGDDAAIIDPGDAAVALELAHRHGLHPRHILHTHGHWDHTAGSAEAKVALGAAVYGHAGDSGLVAPDVNLAGAHELTLGALSLRVHQVPGHTPGSVLYEWRGRLFTGDTLFWGGVGNCKSGDSVLLAQSVLTVLAALDGALEVHPGHDYAEDCLSFALELDPGNGAARELFDAARVAREAGREPRASTLADERASNPFLRVADVQIREALIRRGREVGDPVATFVSLRRLRDE